MWTELLAQVEATSRITVRNRGDCERLSAMILERTDAFLSYNTLRRLYGLSPGGTPQRRTLDVLAVFCGFAHFDDFNRRSPALSEWHLKTRLHPILTEGSTSQLVAFFEDLPAGNLTTLDLLLSACRELLAEGRWTDLASLLDLKLHRPSAYDYTYQIHFALSLGGRIAALPELPPADLLSHPGMVQSVYLRLIDYSALNGYYGAWTDLLQHRPISNEAAIFVACLDQFRAFLDGRPLPPFFIQLPPGQRHPVALVGRVFTVQRMRAPDADLDALWNAAVRAMPPEDESLSIYIEPSMFAVVAGDLQLTAWLCQQVRMSPALLQEFQQHDLQVHILLQTMHALAQGQQSQAEKWFRQFNSDLIRHPTFSALLLFAIRRIEAELEGTHHVFPADVEAMSARLGHAWFSPKRWHRFFD